jgi:hypothetical protein
VISASAARPRPEVRPAPELAGKIGGELGDARDGVGQGVEIDRRAAAKAREQQVAAQAREHGARFRDRHRRQRRHGVVDQLHQHAARAHHHHRPDRGIDTRAHDHLRAGHRLHEHARAARGRAL